MPWAMIANSSPPSRATVSPPRTMRRNRSPTPMSRASPAPCPCVSFTDLNWSRSRNITANGTSPTIDSAWWSWSLSSSRLPRPVRGSCRVWWTRSCSAERRSVMSSAWATAQAGRPSSFSTTAAERSVQRVWPSAATRRSSMLRAWSGPSRSSDSRRSRSSVSSGSVSVMRFEARTTSASSPSIRHRPGLSSRMPPSSSTMAIPIGAWVKAAWKRATASTAGRLGPLAARDVLDVEHEAQRLGAVALHQRRAELHPHRVALRGGAGHDGKPSTALPSARRVSSVAAPGRRRGSDRPDGPVSRPGS